jgi:hypothetical protein
MADSRQHIQQIETVPIDSTGEVFTETIEIAKLVSINIEGESSATYELDLSPDNKTAVKPGSTSAYFEGVETYTGTSISDTFDVTDRYLRIRVTSTGNANDEAVITLQGVR